MTVFRKIEEDFIEGYEGWIGAEQFKGTGARLARMMKEMCWPNEAVEKEVNNCFKAVFDNNYDEMLVSEPTSVWTLCPHHLVPVHFEVAIGYVPNGQVLGLSKFSRVALAVGKRPIMQEQYTQELAESIMNHLSPKGCAVYVVGVHGCIGCRGVQQDVRIHTAVVKGVFDTDPKTREEFYRIVKGK